MAGAMIALSSGPPLDAPSGRTRPGRNGGVCLWEGSPYNAGGYPPGYSNQANRKLAANEQSNTLWPLYMLTSFPHTSVDNYPPHYHSHSAHYGASSWVMHGGGQGGSPYGFRAAHNGDYGRSSFANQPSSWTSATSYGGFPASQSGGAGGPMRLNYQHRGWGPYGSKLPFLHNLMSRKNLSSYSY